MVSSETLKREARLKLVNRWPKVLLTILIHYFLIGITIFGGIGFVFRSKNISYFFELLVDILLESFGIIAERFNFQTDVNPSLVISLAIIGFTLLPLITGGLYLIKRDVLKGHEVKVRKRLFTFFKDIKQGLKLIVISYLRTLRIILMIFVLVFLPIFSQLLIFLPLLFILVHIVIVSIPIVLAIIVRTYIPRSMAIYLMADDASRKIGESIKLSKRLMLGHKWEYFILNLSFIGHYLLIILTLGIYGVYAIPYIQTTKTNYYLHLTQQN